MHIVIGILAAIVIFAVLVIVHEGGHFFAAKALGVKVNEFSVGMGPLIFKRQKGDTQYSLRAFPVGGYVAMEGESEESDDGRAFCSKPAWLKAVVLAAGPFMNFLLAVLVIGCMITYLGTSYTPYIQSVADGSPAMEAGIEAGDRIISVGGVETETADEISEAVAKASEVSDRVEIQYEKPDGKTVVTAEAGFAENEDGSRYIGIVFKAKHNIFTGMVRGVQLSAEMEKEMFHVLMQLFTGHGSADDVVGPVGIVNIVDQTAQAGFINLIYLMALLSLNLGLVNILPFPALDGGRLVFLLIRGIAGKKITDSMENAVNFFGMMMLFAFMILITMKDIGSLF